jgi:hypothetical protein
MIQLTLPTMTCQHCVRTVTEAPGVSTQTAQAVAAALAEAGYEAV